MIRSNLSVDPARAARAREHFRVDCLTYLFSDRLGMSPGDHQQRLDLKRPVLEGCRGRRRVEIDQERCRGYRKCVEGCPYTKSMYRGTTRTSEKCVGCYPRIEGKESSASQSAADDLARECLSRFLSAVVTGPYSAAWEWAFGAENQSLAIQASRWLGADAEECDMPLLVEPLHAPLDVLRFVGEN
jgi:ferredoxin